MRSIAVVLTIACSGCVIPAVTAALMPVVVPAAMGGDQRGQGESDFAVSHVGADDAHALDAGWALAIRSNAFLAKDARGAFGVGMYGRTELGLWGRDRLYGITGLTVGPGFRLPMGGFVAVGAGYEYGGYPQIGHVVPLRGQLWLRKGKVGLRASGYVGWRFHIRDEWPAATETIGPWNTWGGDAMLTLTGQLEGVGVGVGYDREDDVDAVQVMVSATLVKR